MDNKEWIDLLYAAQVSNSPSPICASKIPEVNQSVSYAAQAGFIELCSASSPISGFKGALTSKMAQKSMGIESRGQWSSTTYPVHHKACQACCRISPARAGHSALYTGPYGPKIF